MAGDQRVNRWVWGLLTLLALPAIFSGGFGPDNDSWGVYNAAFKSWQLQELHISRMPGNLMHEGLCHLLFWIQQHAGLSPAFIPISLCLYSFFCAMGAYLLFTHFLQREGSSQQIASLASASLLCGPAALIHTFGAIEYFPALFFGLLAFYLYKRSPWLAALSVYLSFANRSVGIFYLLPLAFLYGREGLLKKRLPTLLLPLLLAILEKSLLLHFTSGPVSGGVPYPFLWDTLFWHTLLGLFGLPAFLWASAFFLFALLVGSLQLWNRFYLQLGLLGLAPHALLWAYFSNDPAYLIPALPFLLLLLLAPQPRAATLWVFCLLQFFSNFFTLRLYTDQGRQLHLGPGPYLVALYQHTLPSRTLETLHSLAQTSSEPKAWVVRPHGIGHSFNGGWEPYLSLSPDHTLDTIQLPPQLGFLHNSLSHGQLHRLIWKGHTFYLLPQISGELLAQTLQKIEELEAKEGRAMHVEQTLLPHHPHAFLSPFSYSQLDADWMAF